MPPKDGAASVPVDSQEDFQKRVVAMLHSNMAGGQRLHQFRRCARTAKVALVGVWAMPTFRLYPTRRTPGEVLTHGGRSISEGRLGET